MMRRATLQHAALLALGVLLLAACAPATPEAIPSAIITPDGTRPTFVFFFSEN